MNIVKHMEAVVMVVFGLICFTGVATAKVPARHAAPRAAVVAKADANMQVITITAKRLTAAEKASLAE